MEGIFSVSNVTLDFETDKVLVSTLDLHYMKLMASFVSKTHPAVLELYIWVKVSNLFLAVKKHFVSLKFLSTYMILT